MNNEINVSVEDWVLMRRDEAGWKFEAEGDPWLWTSIV